MGVGTAGRPLSQLGVGVPALGMGCGLSVPGAAPIGAPRPTSAAAPQFLQGERGVGQNRAEVSQQLLAALNPDVEVSVHPGELSEEFLAAFQVSLAPSPGVPWGSSAH